MTPATAGTITIWRCAARPLALEDVLDAVTLTPARLLHREELASMEVGTTADLAVLRVVSKDLDYSDMAGHRMKGSQAIVPR